MALAVKKCRVCGKEYEACRSAVRHAGVFRWQEVACSPECGSIYLRQINESRGLVEDSKKAKGKKPAVEHVKDKARDDEHTEPERPCDVFQRTMWSVPEPADTAEE